MSVPDVAGFDPGEILRALEAHHGRYIVIGAIAAIAAGAPVMTTDLDITADRVRENLERLARALDDLQARRRSRSDPEGVAFPVDADMLESADSWTLLTRAGNLDVVFSPAGRAAMPIFAATRRGSELPASQRGWPPLRT